MNLGRQMVKERRADVRAEKPDVEGSRDLLTLLLKANMDPDVPESQRLSEEDVIVRKPLQSSTQVYLSETLSPQRSPHFWSQGMTPSALQSL